MLPPQKYQLVVLGSRADLESDKIGEKLNDGFREFGLDPTTCLERIDEVHAGDVDWKAFPAAVWFGTDKNDPEPPILADLLRRGAPVFPLLETTDGYQNRVPDCLCPINGRSWDDDRVVGDLMSAFRLTRSQRQAFISYKRSDASVAAADIFDALSRRNYQVFLDAASVEAGVRFQDVLWDRLADIDLVVLLDTPNALNSTYVVEEITRIRRAGLGVVQVVWPGHAASPGVVGQTPIELDDLRDFENGDFGPLGSLKKSALDRIASEVEAVRIRSLGARRAKLVEEFILFARQQFDVDVQPAGPIFLRTQGAAPDEPPQAIAVPRVGLVDALSLHTILKELLGYRDDGQWEQLQDLDDLLNRRFVGVVYDGTDMEAGRMEHVAWLNQSLTPPAISLDFNLNDPNRALDAWLQNVLAAGNGGVP